MASFLIFTLFSLCFLPSSISQPTPVSFPLTHRDAESSLIRSADADPSDLPEGMAMRGFVASGRAMRGRLEKQRKNAPGPVYDSFSYLGKSVGDFYLTISVGNPPQRLIFIPDTGSELTWTNCKPCKICSTSGGPVFASNKSSSYMAVPCTSFLCIQSLAFTAGCSNATGFCPFQVGYLAGEVDTGYISVDSFHLSRNMSKSLVFGCATVQLNASAILMNSSGILGLNAGPFSFTSQLLGGSSKLPNKFAYCVPDRFTNLNSQGTIVFGESELPANLSYTPLVPPFGPLGYLAYFVKLEGISVGKTFIKAAMEGASLDGGGTFFDSGSGVSLLVRPLYVKMMSELRRQTAALKPFELEGDVCYRVPLNATELPKVPLITMHFAGGVDLELGPDSVLVPFGSDDQSIVLCAAFVISTSSNLNIIGNYQQQNYWVEYDLQAYRLGLGKANCATRS